MAAVNPEILVWARETAALDVEEAAEKLRLGDSKKGTAIEKLKKLESGEEEPSQSQLQKMSKVYHQPLLTFYLSRPPRRGDRGQDFRSLPQQGFDRKGNARLDLLMRDIKAAQSLVSNLLEDDKAEPVSFVGAGGMSRGYEGAAGDIAAILKFDLGMYREAGKVRDAFGYLRGRIEAQGVYVLLKSDLGSHHTTIPVEVFRGFVFADAFAPFIVINRQDAVSAWSFTALHEVAHLWLGSSGVSGAWGEQEIEVFCNRAASEILLPAEELGAAAFDDSGDMHGLAEQIGAFAKERHISGAMVAYRLLQRGSIGRGMWQSLRELFAERWRAQAEQERSALKGRSGGPSYYAVKQYQLGPGLIGMAREYVGAGLLTPSKAGIVMGVNIGKVYRFLYPERYPR